MNATTVSIILVIVASGCTVITSFMKDMRKILLGSGVHLYAPAYCAVNADKRFIYVLAEKKMHLDINFKAPRRCKNIFTGEIYESTFVISAELDEGNCIFLRYLE